MFFQATLEEGKKIHSIESIIESAKAFIQLAAWESKIFTISPKFSSKKRQKRQIYGVPKLFRCKIHSKPNTNDGLTVKMRAYQLHTMRGSRLIKNPLFFLYFLVRNAKNAKIMAFQSL